VKVKDMIDKDNAELAEMLNWLESREFHGPFNNVAKVLEQTKV
jgi:hypothetical protein